MDFSELRPDAPEIAAEPDSHGDALINAVRSILLGQDRSRLEKLEQELLDLQHKLHSRDEALSQQMSELLQEIAGLHAALRRAASENADVQTEVSLLKRQSQQDSEGMVERLTPVMTNLVRRTIKDSPDDMAEALGPVMGEAIRVQIRDSRQDMVAALYPIIGETVQKAVGEFAREFQRNIDARLRSTFGPGGFLRRLTARLRGVSDSELMLRDALPFQIRQVFLIQHGSGLLLAHHQADGEQATDSDLVGAMLTAIGSFVRDAFQNQPGDDGELDEIQYGDQRIVVQSGKHAYIAVVYSGVEPEGFRAALRTFISNLHLKYSRALRDYSGDAAALPNLPPQLSQLTQSITQPAGSTLKISPWLVFSLLAGFILLTALGCFYLRFTLALLPLAFPSPTTTLSAAATITATATVTASATASQTTTATTTPSVTLTDMPSPTASQTATATQTPTASQTPTTTQTPTPTLTPTPVEAYMNGNVWARTSPSENGTRYRIVTYQTPVKVKAISGFWTLIEWFDDGQLHSGWVPFAWVTFLREVAVPVVGTATATPRP